MGVSGGWVGWLTRTGRSFSESAEESYQGKDGTCMVCLVGSRGLGLSRLALWCSPVNVGAKSSCAHFLFLGIDFLRYLPLPSNLSALFLFPFSWTGSACVHSWGGGMCPMGQDLIGWGSCQLLLPLWRPCLLIWGKSQITHRILQKLGHIGVYFWPASSWMPLCSH